MHEESLTRSLLRQVDELARQNRATEVEEIEVECGPLSGVEPLLLQSAFERLQSSFGLTRSAKLAIREVGLEIVCLDCHAHSQLTEFHFVCPICDSTSLRVVRGDSLLLLDVRLTVPEAPRLEFVPKARNMTAQGAALGPNEARTLSPEQLRRDGISRVKIQGQIE